MFQKTQNIKNICKKTHKNSKCNKNNAKNKLKIVVHPVTIIFAILSVLTGLFWLFFIYFFSIMIHEFCHMIIAKKLGYFCNRITLYPTGTLLSGDTDEFGFKDEILIALAGPISNLIMCVICVFLWWILPSFYNYSADFVVANLSIAFFNLLPIFPLDGGRVVLAILSNIFPRKKACNITKKITIIFAIVLFVFFIFSLLFRPNFQIGLSAIVIFISGISENKEAVYKRIVKTDFKRRKLKHGLKVVSFMFSADTKLIKVVSKIDNFAFYNIFVVDQNFNVVATLNENQVYDLAQKVALNQTLKEVLMI